MENLSRRRSSVAGELHSISVIMSALLCHQICARGRRYQLETYRTANLRAGTCILAVIVHDVASSMKVAVLQDLVGVRSLLKAARDERLIRRYLPEKQLVLEWLVQLQELAIDSGAADEGPWSMESGLSELW